MTFRKPTVLTFLGIVFFVSIFGQLINFGTKQLVFAEENIPMTASDDTSKSNNDNSNSDDSKCLPDIQPGKQIAGSIELPWSNAVWNWEKTDLLGKPTASDKSKTETLHFWIYFPKDCTKTSSSKTEKTFPLLLFLHGAGERGTDLEKVKVHGPAKLCEKGLNPQTPWPFITVSPQCPDGKYWSAPQLLLLLDEIEAFYPIDKTRVYVSGLSMGGFGTWALLRDASERFAAAAPVCGGCDPEYAEKMLDVPVWLFHGEQDSVVPVELDKKIASAIHEKGGKNLKETYYPDLNHDCWTKTYANPELYQWLLNQKNTRLKNNLNKTEK